MNIHFMIHNYWSMHSTCFNVSPLTQHLYHSFSKQYCIVLLWVIRASCDFSVAVIKNFTVAPMNCIINKYISPPFLDAIFYNLRLSVGAGTVITFLIHFFGSFYLFWQVNERRVIVRDVQIQDE